MTKKKDCGDLYLNSMNLNDL